MLALALAAGLAVPSGVALAAPGRDGEPPHGHAVRCKRAEHRLHLLERLAARLQEHRERIQARIDSGGLSDEQLARAQAVLERLGKRLERLDDRIAALEARLAEHCEAPAAA
jgi:chromosome segregation ATPase